MRERLFSYAAGLVCRNPWKTFGAALLLTALAALAAMGLQVKMDWSEMLPAGHPMVESYRKMESEMGGSDYMIFALRHADGGEARRASDELVAELAADPDIISASNRLDLDFYRGSALYLADEEELGELWEGLRLMYGMDTETARGLISGELRSREKEIARTLGYGYDEDHYMISPSGDWLLVLARPVRGTGDYSFTIPFAKRMGELAEGLEERHPGLEVLPGGNYFFAYEEKACVDADMVVVMALAVLVILTVYTLFFGSVSYPLLSLLCLVMSVIWTMALMRLVVGSLNFITSVLAGILMGIGVDYSVHILSRYREEMESHGDRVESFRQALSHAGMGVFTGAATTAAAFFVIVLGESRAFRQTGFFLGAGVLLCFLSMMTVLPAVVTLKERRFPLKPGRVRGRMLSLERLGEVAVRRRWAFIACAAALTALAVFGVTRVQYDYDMWNIEPAGLKSERVKDILVGDFGMSFDYSVAFDTDLAEVRRKAGELRGLDEVGKVEALTDLLPEDVDGRARRLAAMREEFYATPLWAGLSGTPEGMALSSMLEAAPPTLEGLPDSLRDTFISASGEFVTYIYPREDPWEERFLRSFVTSVREVEGGITGTPVVFYDLLGVLKGDLGKATGISMLAVFLLLLFDFKRLSRSVYAFLPLCMAVLWMVGLMGLTGFRFDIVNIVVTPMIVGMGIDFGVILMHRAIEEGEVAGGIPVAMGTTGRAILASGLTTAGAFACLLFASYRGFRSMGLAAVIGLVFAVVVSVTVLPAILGFAYSRRRG